MVDCMRLREARKLAAKCVYIICTESGKPVYIGRTRNTKSRFGRYMRKKSHNVGLNEWLQENPNPFVRVIEVDDIAALEIDLIKRYQEQIFNKVQASNLSWQKHQTKPWMARTGIHCPSSLALMAFRSTENAENAERSMKIRRIRKSMSDLQRVQFEIETAQDMLSIPCRYHGAVNKWLDFVSEGMIAYLQDNDKNG